MEGYRIPPVMFTESEANALVTAEQLILKNKDASFVKEYSEAINKIKSVLRNKTKDKANLLSDRTVFRQNADNNRTSNYLSTLQLALTNFNLVRIKYHSPDTNETTERTIEPLRFTVHKKIGCSSLSAYYGEISGHFVWTEFKA